MAEAHSVRGASCSTALGAGVTTKDILDAADWSSEGTFQRFIVESLRTMTKLLMVLQFCHLVYLQTIHVDMELSLPICNLQMAQGTKCLHAINYMRKVK